MIQHRGAGIPDQSTTQTKPCSDPTDATLDSATRHFSPGEIADLWGLSVDTIRRLFENEPGVVIIEPTGSRFSRRRRYRTLRIPGCVAERVHRRLSVVNQGKRQ